MVRATLSLLTGVAALACCAQAFALSSATANVQAEIVRPAGINVMTRLVLPTVTTTAVTGGGGLTSGGAVGSTSDGSTPGGANGPSRAGNATLTIYGQAGDAVSMAVPESFTVLRTGGTESLTVKTNTNMEYGLSGDGVVLGGTVMGGNTMSVNVGGSIPLASTSQASPGAYEGLLVVVVQYN
jgi:hypothetical protein